MTKRNTKAELLDHGVQLLLDRGYHSTGIQEVLKAAEVPKGSFYHHFGSKEDFGLQVAEQYADAGYALLDAMLNDQSKPALERVRSFFEQIFEDWSSGDCRHGCLLGNLGQELADVNEPFRLFIAATMDRWTERIARCLAEAQQEHDTLLHRPLGPKVHPVVAQLVKAHPSKGAARLAGELARGGRSVQVAGGVGLLVSEGPIQDEDPRLRALPGRPQVHLHRPLGDHAVLLRQVSHPFARD